MCVVIVDTHMERVYAFVYDKIALVSGENAAVWASFSPNMHLEHSLEMHVCVCGIHTHTVQDGRVDAPL